MSTAESRTKTPGIFRLALREAALIVAAGSVLGLMYTGVTGQGIFASRASGPAQDSSVDEHAPEFVDHGEALQLFRSGKALFLDARHEFDYELGHIAGAVNLPLKEFEEKRNLLASLSKDTLIVTYCDGQECNSSLELATKLSAAGFSKVKFFFGGWREWQMHNNPTEKAER